MPNKKIIAQQFHGRAPGRFARTIRRPPPEAGRRGPLPADPIENVTSCGGIPGRDPEPKTPPNPPLPGITGVDVLPKLAMPGTPKPFPTGPAAGGAVGPPNDMLPGVDAIADMLAKG